MQKIFSYRDRISATIQTIGEEEKTSLNVIHPSADETINKLISYCTKGKMIRGSLMLFGFEMWGGVITDRELKIAAAMELIQSGFLIHDDVMDNDLVRRGEPSMHVKYAHELEKSGVGNDDAAHLGEALAICQGDIAFFLLMKILVQQRLDPSITDFIIQETLYVGMGQMADIRNSFAQEMPSVDDMLKVFKYKTGRYTFSLPLSIGAMLQSKTQNTISRIQGMGESMGIVFQIVDDHIGLFGTEEQIGKPVGSDLRENKKTLYRVLLDQKATVEEKVKIESICGNKNLTHEDVEYIKELVTSYGIVEEINKLIKDYDGRVRAIIDSLKNEISEEYYEELLSLLEYNTNRIK